MKKSGEGDASKLKESSYDNIDEAAKETFPTSDPPSWTLGSNEEVMAASDKSDTVTQTLANEHHVIRKSIIVLVKVITSIQNGEHIDPAVFKQINDFFILFLVQNHYLKKEIVFPLLNQGDRHPSDYMLNDLKRENDMGRLMYGTLNKTITAPPKESKAATKRLILLLKEILNLNVNHIAKEEEYILPVIATILTVEQKKQVMLAFKQIDEKMDSAEKLKIIKSIEVLMLQL